MTVDSGYTHKTYQFKDAARNYNSAARAMRKPKYTIIFDY